MFHRPLFSFFILFMCIGVYVGVFGLSTAQKKVILQNFQKQQYELLFESDTAFLDETETEVLGVSQRLNIYDSISARLSVQREELQVKKQNLSNVIASLQEALDELDRQVELANQKIRYINNQVIATKKQVKQVTQRMHELQQKITQSNEVLLEYMIYLYKRSHTLYGDEDIDPLKYVLLNDDSVSDAINDLYYTSLAQVAGSNIVDEHRSLVQDLYTQKLTLQRDEKKLKSLRKSEILEKSMLEDRLDFRARLLEASQGKQAQYEKFIQDRLDLERNVSVKQVTQKIKFRNIQKQLLEKHGCEFVDISQNSAELRSLSKKCLNLNKIIYSESKLSDIELLEKNIAAWPVIPSTGISAYFKDSAYLKEFGADHNAIDIPVRQGTPVRSTMDGYVIHVAAPTSDQYSFIAVKHPEGFVSVYGHLSETSVAEFDFVESGQLLGFSGGEFGTPGAGYLTTGPHLHFEIFRDKQPVDPLSFMDISILAFEDIPEKYRFKYYEDFEARKGYAYKEAESQGRPRFRIQGNDEIERQKYLLNTYARSDFRDWEMWVSESLDADIDPTFVMCIGLAESGLGANLKTAYNVGNVGNTDSGDIKKFPNPRSGVYAIVRTLNNRYLSRYNTVDKLSCYGNFEARLCDRSKPVGHFVYASSPDHWHNNIIKCMSHVKGVYVPDDYSFRLKQ